MWNVVVVDPGDGRASLYCDALRSEGELVNNYIRVRSLRRDGGGRRCEQGSRKRGCNVNLACYCCSHDGNLLPQPCSGLSMIASRCCPRLKVTSVTPRRERSLSSGTFIGPGEGAVPGAGCGKAVDMAV